MTTCRSAIGRLQISEGVLKLIGEAAKALGVRVETLRRWDRPRLQAGERAYCPGLGWLRIEAVDLEADRTCGQGAELGPGT